MIRSLYTAASGMLTTLRQQDVVADNLANSSTVGYKANQSAQTAFAGVLARRIGPSDGPVPGRTEELIGRVGTGSFVENVRTFLGQGAERQTGLAMDAMILGDGFFVVQTPEGVRYTRDGHFDRNDAQQLMTADGALVLDTEGNSIVLATDQIRIRQNGDIFTFSTTTRQLPDGTSVAETEEEFVARFQLVNLQADALVRAGDSKFAVAPGAAVTPIDLDAGETLIMQGSLEEANVNVGEAATRMYSVARDFTSSQRVFSEINKTLETAVADLGRV